MDNKETIAHRITASREALGITIKELAKRTGTLSAARISNWEQATRRPGPAEAKVLANVLDVAASYLLCLSDDPRGDLVLQHNVLPRQLLLIPLADANLTKNKLQRRIKNLPLFSEESDSIYLKPTNTTHAGPYAFATRIDDSSMSPAFMPGDIVIVDLDRKPKPGHYVLAHDHINNTNIIRKYKERTPSKKDRFELAALNTDWGNIEINNAKQGKIIATVIEHRRYYA